MQIVWINILLSGDNAVVIALACRDLPADRRRIAVVLGGGVAVALRIVLTFFVVALLSLPYVKLLSGALLLWIAFDLLWSEKEDSVAPASSLWTAVRTIAIADAVMSLDNVVAVAAAANNSLPLIVFGIAFSVPLIVFGSTLILKLLERVPLLVVVGAALLGWVAGEIIGKDPVVERWLGSMDPPWEILFGLIGATVILLTAMSRWLLRRFRHHGSKSAA